MSTSTVTSKTKAQGSERTRKDTDNVASYYQANQEKIKSRAAARYKRDPRRTVINNRKRLSGFTEEMFRVRLAIQDTRCAICRVDLTTVKRLAADHDHKSKQPRGILCCQCNLMLGHAKDSTETLQAAITYLDFWRSNGNQR